MGNAPGIGTSAPQFSLQDVRFSYRPGHEVLHGISLDIRAGEHICILGGNGSGKSTLAQLLNALLVPDGGCVRAFGLDTADPEAVWDIRSKAALVFQHPDDQMVASIVADDVAFGPENLGVDPAEIAKRVSQALEAVGMADFALEDPAHLSGGQRQRVAIAGALAMGPQALVLDEPGAMLDVRGRRGIRRIARELVDRGITVVHITHFMEDALDAGRVIVLDRGHVALDGSPDEIFSQPKLVRELGLELPFALHVAEDLAARGLDVGSPVRMQELVDRVAARSAAGTGRDGASAQGNGEGNPPERPAGTAGEPSVSFRDVSFSYACEANARTGKRRRGRDAASCPLALEHASFSVPRGSLTALVGHTGSGKSTALELACALKLPLGGSVLADGIDTTDMGRRRELHRRIGYVAQLPERQLFAETVYDDVAFGPRNLGLPDAEVAARVEGALDMVGLSDRGLWQRSPFALSGGQQHSAALAGVLAMGQGILALDEPMAGLDPAGRERVRGLLRRLRESGTSILLITHSMDDVAELADRVVVLDHGRVALDGTPGEMFSHDAELRRIGLGSPSALACARALSNAGVPIGAAPLTAGALVEAIATALGAAPRKEVDDAR